MSRLPSNIVSGRHRRSPYNAKDWFSLVRTQTSVPKIIRIRGTLDNCIHSPVRRCSPSSVLQPMSRKTWANVVID